MNKTSIVKKLFFAVLMTALLFVLLCLAANAATYSGSCGAEGDNLTWTLDTETGELVISGTGAMADYTDFSRAPWSDYREMIKTVTLQNGITSIGNYAFLDNPKLVSIAIPDSVTSIGERAFDACRALTDVNIPTSVTDIGGFAFFQCTSLESIIIPEGVTTIAENLFCFCSGLTSVTLPDSITSIENNAFQDCLSLISISIPKNVKSIGMCAFGSLSSLASVSVDKDNSIYYSESNCLIEKESKKLILGCKNSVIPEDVVYIGLHAFFGCTDLETITIPESVIQIGEWAFSHCESLTSITIPKNVIYFDSSSFQYCSSLESISIDPDNEHYYSEGNCLIRKDIKMLVLGCKTSVIPEDITSIGAYAFEGCAGLTSIIIPEGVTEIGTSAFWSCTSLESITIPSSVTSIGFNAFYNCKKLESVTVLSKNALIIDSEQTFSPSATIYGYAGSTAQNYAAKYDRPFVVLEEPIKRGDMNGDELVDANDAIHLLRHVLFADKFPINQDGDMDANGELNANDAIYLLRHVLFPEKFPLS